MRPQKTQLLDISDFAWPVLFEQQQKQLLWELVVICINKVELFLFFVDIYKSNTKNLLIRRRSYGFICIYKLGIENI